MIDHFLTIENPGESLVKDKSSKFYAYAYPVQSIEDIEQRLQEIKKVHLKARHFCYAYILGADKQNFRANDDGEPSGTAGRPIFGQLEKRNIVNTLVVVVRYFGGTKLGTSGLIKAYKEAASLALDNTEIKEEILTKNLIVSCTYEDIGTIMNIVTTKGYHIVNTFYQESVSVVLKIRISEINDAIKYIKAKMLSRSIEDIQDDTEVDHVNFSFI